MEQEYKYTSVGYLRSKGEQYRQQKADAELKRLELAYPDAKKEDLKKIAESTSCCPRCGGFPRCACE